MYVVFATANNFLRFFSPAGATSGTRHNAGMPRAGEGRFLLAARRSLTVGGPNVFCDGWRPEVGTDVAGG
jgi:hypothetical protein